MIRKLEMIKGLVRASVLWLTETCSGALMCFANKCTFLLQGFDSTGPQSHFGEARVTDPFFKHLIYNIESCVTWPDT